MFGFVKGGRLDNRILQKSIAKLSLLNDFRDNRADDKSKEP